MKQKKRKKGATDHVSREEARLGRYFDSTPEKVQDVLRSRDLRLLASGPAGTGKTTTVLEKMRACCLKYPRTRALILRSVRKWLTQSALVTWEERVLSPNEWLIDDIRRDGRTEYRFPNKSLVVVAGLDDPKQVMSADYDLAFICEATEVSQDTVEHVVGRLRNDVMPYQQLLMDCNPGPPTHWLKRESDAGQIRRIDTMHVDNPAYYNQETREWTPAGRAYMAVLDTLTGNRRARLRDGQWRSAEGVVYESWSSVVHVIDRIPQADGWPRWWSFDFGFTHPFVWQEWVEDGDGRSYLNREIYHTQILVEDHARRIKELSKGKPRPRALICDHDAEGRATLERYLGMQTVPAEKAVTAGIQDVDSQLRLAKDGKPRLFVFRDALDHRDESLEKARKPSSTEQEFDGYIWDTGASRRKGEAPLKKDDHGMDCARYYFRHRAAGRGGGRAKDISSGGERVMDNAPEGVWAMV